MFEHLVAGFQKFLELFSILESIFRALVVDFEEGFRREVVFDEFNFDGEVASFGAVAEGRKHELCKL
jgi:hypothetical protein